MGLQLALLGNDDSIDRGFVAAAARNARWVKWPDLERQTLDGAPGALLQMAAEDLARISN